MTLRMKALLGLICLIVLSVLAGCAKATPTAVPTPSAAPTEQPTETQSPTETLSPTETPAPSSDTQATVDPNNPGGQELGSATAAPAGNATAAPTTAAQPPAANPPAGGAVADKYQYLGQDVADRSQFLPNRTVTITWTVKNVGTNGWTKDYAMRYFSGPKATKDVYPFGKDVPAGATINFTVTFTTPSELGTYDMWFKLTNLEGKNFGDLDLVYTVTNNPQKATSTPTK